MQDKIVIRGAREHNLKNISLELPRNKLIVFTGLSGSGKSSLAFDTIFAEGQRRYVESLSAYARQFLGQMDKPDVDEIEGLSPAISIDQKAHSANPRSTVATITEIYDYLRVLFARVGRPHCVQCRKPIQKLTVEEMVNVVIERIAFSVENVAATFRSPDGSLKVAATPVAVTVLAPIVRGRKGEYHQMLYDLYNEGFSEVRVNGAFKKLKERIVLARYKAHTIELVVDRVPVGWPIEGNKALRSHLAEAIEVGLKYGHDVVTIVFDNPTQPPLKLRGGERRGYTGGEGGVTELTMSSKFSCPDDGFSFPEIEPRLFSFNSPYGACPDCHGLGTESLFSEKVCLVCKGARLKPESLQVYVGGRNIVEVTGMNIADAHAFFNSLGFTVHNPSQPPQNPRGGDRSETPLNIRGGRGSYDKQLTDTEFEIAFPVLREVTSRIKFMLDVGLDYLTLERKAGTLSGGEAQRIRLASQLGSRLTGTLYVLDEPTIGLHQRDNARLIKTLLELRDLGNTVIVVEHDPETIRAADYLVDLGPEAGKSGGYVVASGELDQLLPSPSQPPQNPWGGDRSETPLNIRGGRGSYESLTLQYLTGQKSIALPQTRRTNSKERLKVVSAQENNLKRVDVEIPLRRFICVTGVSGSGKSTLVNDILYKALANRFNLAHHIPGRHKAIVGLEYLDGIVEVDQSPIGRTPRSNPATYAGVFTHIRDLFAALPESRMRGYKAGRFSFNVSTKRGGGRCENCEGNGLIAIEMHFLPTVYVKCDICKGKRFDRETLEVLYKGKNIFDVLSMTIDEADDFFRDIPHIHDRLKVLREVGLGYLEIGQSATTLSGGEAQRVKLGAELAGRRRGRILYILDEPTVGLHYEDVRKLVEVLQRLVSAGNTVLVIEHNLDVIKSADYLIDLGPEGGDRGGEVVAIGTPEEVARNKKSYTGQYLRTVL
ncbi:MAG: Excinuclease ABC, A subunit [Parcubacteria group bacterium GW2011_GWA2_47_26]|nr:MAG: Excinuclease ABC, A subunit [Parcubacteria group bacterium GW2011_GWA2_47_26]